MSNGPHLTTDGISAAFEELLPEREQRAADAHLAGCGRCQAVLDELIGIRRALHQVGAQTPPMPASVQDRLEAVIAAESTTRRQAGVRPVEPVAHLAPRPSGSSGPRGRGSHRSKHVAPRSKPRSRKRSHSRSRGGTVRIFAIAAGLVVLAAGSLVAFQTIFANQNEPTVVMSQPSSPSASSKPPRNSGEYLIAGRPELTAQDFAKDVDAAVKPGKPVKPTKVIGPQAVPPDFCATRKVTAESGLPALGVAEGSYDGQRAFLVITESKTANSVDAYVVTGCPGRAKIARDKTTVAISN